MESHPSRLSCSCQLKELAGEACGGTESGAKASVRRGGGRGEAGTGGVKVASIGMGQIETEEPDSPMARGAGVISGSLQKASSAVASTGRSIRAEGPAAWEIRV
jgi:hypothetical protein